ncbi:MAG: hypothetical protein R3A47_03775 [Polyangiales bacterium]
MAFQLPFFTPLSWKFFGTEIAERISMLENLPHVSREGEVRDGISGIQLYRANFLPALARPRQRFTDVPVQLIVQTNDAYVGAQLFTEIDRWVIDLHRVETDATHWSMLADGNELALSIRRFADLQRSERGTLVRGES